MQRGMRMTNFESEFVRRNELSHALAMACLLQDHFLEMRETAERSLIRVLPGLLSEDRVWVDSEQVAALAAALNADTPALTLTLLEALGKVGDRRAIRKVQALRIEVASRSDVESNSLRNAADSCIAQLKSTAAHVTQAQTLLRASRSPTAGASSTMLRPAGAAPEAESTELMRASAAESPPEIDEPTARSLQRPTKGDSR